MTGYTRSWDEIGRRQRKVGGGELVKQAEENSRLHQELGRAQETSKEGEKELPREAGRGE